MKHGKKLTTPVGKRAKSSYPSPGGKGKPNPLNRTKRAGMPKATGQGSAGKK